MATTITFQIANVTAQRTFTNDQMASAITSAFYADQNLGPDDATNQQKLTSVLNWFIEQMRTRAKIRFIDQAASDAMADAEQEYDLS